MLLHHQSCCLFKVKVRLAYVKEVSVASSKVSIASLNVLLASSNASSKVRVISSDVLVASNVRVAS